MRGNGRMRVLTGRSDEESVRMGARGKRGQDSARNKSADPDFEVAALLPC